MDDLDAPRGLPLSEDSLSLSINIEDSHYSALQADLEADARDLDRESWSVSVDQQYIKTLPKYAVKRQDVIYELIQTEVNYVRTLKLLLSVYQYELRNCLQEEELERMFPQTAILLNIHQHFLHSLRERQERQNHYVVPQLGDVLINQFSGAIGESMKVSYGLFCSHHTDAVSFYKEQLQTNKKFQNLIMKISRLSVVRRLGVPECILLVTQRITKYPVLVERILQNTDADCEEHSALTKALALIKETISAVDSQVHDFERAFRLSDIISRLDPRSHGRLKDGRVLGKDDLRDGSRTLLHEGTVNWRAANGRLKEIHAVLLSDILLLLQMDQKITFANLDNKPSVISLQVLIMRELAHDDSAMYLISDSSSFPEMYEIHTSSKEERATWMSLIRDAVDSCPTEQDEAMLAVLREFQESVSRKDAQVKQCLTEKLQMFAEMAEAVAGLEDVANHSHLLFHGDDSDLQQGETLLNGIIIEVESLQSLLHANVTERNPNPVSEDGIGPGGLDLGLGELRINPQGLGNLVALSRAKTFGGHDYKPITQTKNGCIPPGECPVTLEGRPLEKHQRSNSDPQLQDFDHLGLEMSADEAPATFSSSCANPLFLTVVLFDRLLGLSQKLYSLLAVVSQQDSYIELQRATLSEYERSGRPCGNVLLEKEKQRNLEKQRVEMSNFHKLQTQHKQEQARWERERERQQRQMEVMDAELRRREEECRGLEEKLAEERGELESQREAYQKDLERLRESAQAVEKEKEQLEQQMKLKKNFSVLNASHSPRESLIHSTSFQGNLHHSQSLRKNISLSQSFHLPDQMSRWSPGLDMTSSQTSKVPTHPSLSLAPGFFTEQPPEVPPRRESISPAPPKPEIPLHLISTKNQVVHKPAVIQQQIPTKLAALSGKAKEKINKKASHHRTHSAASIDISKVVPIAVTGKESGSLKGKKKKKNMSPLRSHQSDSFFSPPDPVSHAKPSQIPSFSITMNNLDSLPEQDQSPPVPPAFPEDVAQLPTMEEVYL